MINLQKYADEFFETIPDALLINMAERDWNSLYKICVALTLDLQLIEEQILRKELKN